ncbi:hypothetical protein GY26_07440 [Gammaproteobacteria bacterium MFB021]|nr:hypothetical protein GY26_07440 [Gammaproteobacteria bacterium MFB021]
MIVGTAGHVDHGKTALIRGLTGIATDRLKEEQARGLTIEPGYAYPTPPPGSEGAVLGFIDVPGHERFIANMLAGAAGIDAMLLVVAADDGIMPQSVEHLRILELLGVERAWVALTKCDRVDAARVQQVSAEITAWLAKTRFAGAPLFAVSNLSGAGQAALGDALWAAARAQTARLASGGFRLAVDRAFVKQGAGVVVTGTIRSGEVRQGDSVRLLPGGASARVRALRAQNREVGLARRGERCALNLSGSEVERGTLARGDWVVAADSRVEGRQRLDVTLTLLPEAEPLKHWTPVHLHHLSAHVTGHVSLLEGETLAPGQTMLAQLVLSAPLHAAYDAALIVRDGVASRTLAGARVLDVAPPRRGARQPARLAWLQALRAMLPGADGEVQLAALWPRLSSGHSIDLVALAANLDLPVVRLDEAATQAGWVVIAADAATHHAFRVDDLAARYAAVVARLAQVHAEEPAMRGAEIDRLRRMSAPALPPALFRPLLERWKAEGEIVQHGPFIALADHRATLGEADAARWQAVRPLLAQTPFEPPRVRDIAMALGLEEGETRALLRRTALLGEVYQLRHDHFFLTPHVVQLADWVRELAARSPAGVTAAAFRDRVGCGRKLAVAILEFFDRIGFTRRIGDGHKVIRQDMLFT